MQTMSAAEMMMNFSQDAGECWPVEANALIEIFLNGAACALIDPENTTDLEDVERALDIIDEACGAASASIYSWDDDTGTGTLRRTIWHGSDALLISFGGCSYSAPLSILLIKETSH